MALRNLNHVLVLVEDLDATRDFYVEVLGLEVGERPPFAFPGYWLYLDEQAVIHLASKDRAGNGKREGAGADGTGAIDHIAFEATGLGPAGGAGTPGAAARGAGPRPASAVHPGSQRRHHRAQLSRIGGLTTAVGASKGRRAGCGAPQPRPM